MAFKKLKLWFDKDLANLLGEKLYGIDSSFDTIAFAKIVDAKVKPLELKDRVEVIADLLSLHLDGDYTQQVNALIKTLGPENADETGMFTNYY